MQPYISVVVSIYNVEKYIDRCLDALLHQTLSNIEIILVDDGSSDGCPKICDAYAKKDSRIKVVHKENGGLGFARNSGMDVATGKYIAFNDPDDYVALDHFENLYHLAEQTQAEVCLGGITDVYPTDTLSSVHPYAGKIMNQKEIIEKLLPSMMGADQFSQNISTMSVCTGIFRMDSIHQSGIRFYSEREYISEDAVFDLMFYPRIQTAAVSHQVSYYYCHNNTSLTTRYNPERFSMYRKLYLYESELAGQFSEPSRSLCLERIRNMYLGNIRVAFKQEAVSVKLFGLRYILRRIHEMLSDECLQDVLESYDSSHLSRNQRIFSVIMERKCTLGVFLLSYLQAKYKNKA